jgi:CBS domain containing-hemolysin-like protein
MWITAAILLSLTLSFLFSGMEAGVLALNRLRIRQRVRAGDSSARVLYGYLEHPEDFLWTILVGNTLANFAAVSLVIHLLHAQLGERQWLLWPSLVLVVFPLYALGDLLPKMLFRQFPNRLCLRLARPFRFVHLALSPLVALMAWLARLLLALTGGRTFTGRLFGNREELRMLMQESGQALSSEERTMINRVLDLQSMTVGDLTVPLSHVVTVTLLTPLSRVLELCREGGLSRLPVRASDGGRITGFVGLRATLYREDLDPARPTGDYLQPALYLDAGVRLEVALQRLQRTGQRIAIVLGRDGQEIGIVTLEDILRFVFGEVNL